MAKYILVYKSKNDWTNLPKDQIVRMMDAWGEWLGSMGPAVVNKGEAFKFGGKKVTSTSTSDADNQTSGYTIVEAKDFDQALGFAKSSPVLRQGDASVEVYEAFAFN